MNAEVLDSEVPNTIFLKDYRKPDFKIIKTNLEFDLREDETIVTSRLIIERVGGEASSLELHGQELELISLTLNNKELSEAEYSVTDESLTVNGLVDHNELICVTKIKPHENTSLEGLYKSQKMYCTQCEAEGFRKITYYLDRPDSLSEFTTRVIANKSEFPVLLSNGNKIESGDLENGRHYAVWHDPFLKPCYLFALVAGNLEKIEDSFTTMSGRDVKLEIFVESKDLDKCDHAMQSLKNSMKWDEEVYGREYDLDIFMIVAVDDFNMGAMENKGLNIFNTSCVLANPKTTTDAGFQRVEGVVAHEYFHNWSGNRVTCRDWFQLSLKEGFTVFRDAEFSSDMGSRTVKRVEDVVLLRTMQFAEDAGPMAHPVRPSSFIEISNFYTLTIYEKGAEVVRMIHTLLGAEKFREGSDLYFERHDGEAVTIEDFVQAMQDVSGRDFSQFMNWYQQAGTPVLAVKSEYNQDESSYKLDFKQSCPETPECKDKKPFVIPIAMGLIGDAGSLPLQVEGKDLDTEQSDNTHTVLEITEESQSVTFLNVKEKPVPSLLRGFSAPVKLKFNYSRDDLVKLISFDDDGFNRWEASQQLAIQVIQEVMVKLTSEPSPEVDVRLIQAFSNLLANESLDQAMVALMLQLQAEQYLTEVSTVVDVESIHHARKRVERKIALSLYDQFKSVYEKCDTAEEFSASADDIARRSLKNTCLHYMVVTGKDEAVEACDKQLVTANNMTDESAALTALVHSTKAALKDKQQAALNAFYNKWQDESLVVNLWFSIQSTKQTADAVSIVKELMQHTAFDIKNPNKLRAVIGGFAMRNPVGFHSVNGKGYEFLADQIIYLNSSNPQIAARLLTPLTQWKKYDENRQKLMKAQLQRIKAIDTLSKDVYEVVLKSLAQ